MEKQTIGANQRIVVNPDGRQSIVSYKLATDPKFMIKHKLQLLDKYEGNPTPVALNNPSKSNTKQEAEIMKQLGISQKDINATDDVVPDEVELDLEIGDNQPVIEPVNTPAAKPNRKGGK